MLANSNCIMDWSLVEDRELRVENMIVSHLLKWVHYLTDTGIGQYDLYSVRDKDQHEVNFLVTKNSKPWILIESKTSNNAELNSSLRRFNQALKPQYTFQLAYDLPYIDFDFREFGTAPL